MPSIFLELLTPSLRTMSTGGEFPLKARIFMRWKICGMNSSFTWNQKWSRRPNSSLLKEFRSLYKSATSPSVLVEAIRDVFGEGNGAAKSSCRLLQSTTSQTAPLGAITSNKKSMTNEVLYDFREDAVNLCSFLRAQGRVFNGSLLAPAVNDPRDLSPKPSR